MRIFCVNCNCWFSTQSPTGPDSVATVDDKYGERRRGDVYTCDGCGFKIIADFGMPYHPTIDHAADYTTDAY